MSTNPYAPPKAAVADVAPTLLKRRSVWLMIVFTLVTLGFYPIIWFFRRRAGLNALNSSRKLKLWPLLALVGFTIVDFVVAFADARSPGSISTGVSSALLVARLAIAITMLVQIFTIKSIIEDHVYTPPDPAAPALFADRVELSGLATFFFSIFYLQYAINKHIVTA
jgi:hypothetical protein